MLHQLRLALNGRIPPAAKSFYLKLREYNADQRALPDFLIIGAQKSGTTSLFNYLCLHPRIVGSVPKEIFYFCSHPERGERWYRRHFPKTKLLRNHQMISGEATPIMLCVAQAPREAQKAVPEARVVAILREPAARAVSHYHHQRRFGRESRTIDEVFSYHNIARWKRGDCPDLSERLYFTWSDYVTGLRNWLEYYPRNQMLVLEAEQLFTNPQASVEKVCAFLELEPHSLPSHRPFNAAPGVQSKPANFAELKAAFASHNHALKALGYPMDWMCD